MSESKSPLEIADLGGGPGEVVEGKKSEKKVIPPIGGGAPTLLEVVGKIDEIRKGRPDIENDEELARGDSGFRDLISQRQAYFEDARRRGLLFRIDQMAASLHSQLEKGTIDIETAKERLKKVGGEVAQTAEPADLKGVFNAFTEKRIGDLRSYISQVEAKHTAQSIAEIPAMLEQSLSEWERMRIPPRAYEEESILKFIARLPAGEKYKIGDQEVSGEELKDFMLARMNFLRLWAVSNNEEGGANPKQMAEIFAGWHDEWFPLLFKNIKTKNGEGLDAVLKYYLGRYEEEDARLQQWIKDNQGLNPDQYDKDLGEFFGGMLIGANPTELRKLRSEVEENYGELAERIGFEFTHMFFSSYFDRGVWRKNPRPEQFPDGTHFTRVMFGNSPYNNRFIDHLEEFMSSESRGRPLINRYFADLVHIIKAERIERDLLKAGAIQKNKDFDENLREAAGIGFKLSELDWGEAMKNPGDVGMGTFFTVYDDREKTAAMRAAVQDFLQGPDERTFMEVLKNFRSSRSGIRDVFVRDFTKQYIDFMRHENRALFDLPNWNTADTERFINGLKGAHLLHEKDANAILREELGISLPVVTPLWALYTPLKKVFPNSPITKAVDNFVHSKFARAIEQFHLPGWWWVRDFRKYTKEGLLAWAARFIKYIPTGK